MVAQSAVALGAAVPTSQRDAAVEDEVLHCGYFADVVFKFRTCGCSEVEEIYGQRALFALLSPPLRRKLSALPPPADGSRSEVWLDSGITAGGFREVARYVYRLAPCFSMSVLPETVAAARAFELQELEASAVHWGLSVLADVAKAGGATAQDPQVACPSDGRSETPASCEKVDDALWCLEQLAVCEPRSQFLGAWRSAMVSAYSADQILLCPAFFRLSPATVQALLEDEAVCNDPGRLWLSVLHWGFARAPAGASNRQRQEVDRKAPPKLFGRGTRLAESLAPTPPPEEIVGWQRQLLPLLDRVHFAQMAPLDFAKNVESVDPMLPELRQAIYAVRRRGAGTPTADRTQEVRSPRGACGFNGESLRHFASRVQFSTP